MTMITSKIGPNQLPSNSYELDIYDHISVIDPKDFGYRGKPFDPKAYFITSGDAIQKTKFLLKELRAYAERIPKDNTDWRAAAEAALIGGQSMLDYLIQARGPSIFLETEWS